MMLEVSLFLLAAVTNALATLTLKFGNEAFRRIVSLESVPPSIDLGLPVSAVLFGVSLLSYSALLKKVPASIAYPVLTGLAVLMVVTASALLGQERLSVVVGTGVLLIIAGVALISVGS